MVRGMDDGSSTTSARSASDVFLEKLQECGRRQPRRVPRIRPAVHTGRRASVHGRRAARGSASQRCSTRSCATTLVDGDKRPGLSAATAFDGSNGLRLTCPTTRLTSW